ncbi:MAG: PQQ-binding-like beta-propeller repeat protein [Acidobacteriota bacterium]
MKKPWMVPVVVLASSCSLFQAKIAPYPSGVTFPLEEAGRIDYQGRIVGQLVQGEEGHVYFSTDQGIVYCLDGRGQKKLWQFAHRSPFGCAPALGPDKLVLWDRDNAVLCLDKDGKQLWKVKVSARLSSGAALDQERVYVGTEEGSLLALSQANGDLLWHFEAGWKIEAEPVLWGDLIIACSLNGSLNFVDRRGRSRGTFEIGGPIRISPLVDGDRLYVGTEDSVFYCVNLKKWKRAWRFRAAGRLLASPRTDEKSVYFPASNSVLYAVNKKGGEIKWWWIMPARSAFRLEIESDKILATSFSPVFVCLEKKTGRELGRYDLKAEVRSNPLYLDPHLLIPITDSIPDQGEVVFLRKKVGVELKSSLSSPQPAGTEISFTASTVGFYLPRCEFTLRQGEEVSVVQPESEKNTWVWFAEKEGKYTVGVRVKDEKLAREAHLAFVINQKKGAVK